MGKKPKKAKNQAIAEEKAFLAGTLPPEDRREEEDRRAPEPEAVVLSEIPDGGSEARITAPVVDITDVTEAAAEVFADVEAPPAVAVVAPPVPAPLIPNDQISVVQERADGTKVTALGSILE